MCPAHSYHFQQPRHHLHHSHHDPNYPHNHSQHDNHDNRRAQQSFGGGTIE